MAHGASGAAQENPLQICSVAHGIPARSASVGSNVVSMNDYVVIPGDRMKRIDPAEMALGTRRSRPPNTIQRGSVAVRIGTGSRAIYLGVIPVQSVCKISPLDGMNRVLIAEVALGAGNL